MKSSISERASYTDICMSAANDNVMFDKFKQQQGYCDILEHTPPHHGQSYLDAIVSIVGLNDAVDMLRSASINDKYGGASIVDYAIGSYIIKISPPTLRYCKIAVELVAMFGNISNKTICEIGGGYGGQCLVMDALFGNKKWDIVDISEANLLQKKYLDINNIATHREFNMSNLSELDEKYDIVISNYAFSECRRDIQETYMDRIISRATNGYMIMNFCWNDTYQGNGWSAQHGFSDMMSEDDIRKAIPTLKVGEEIPNTHHRNKLYHW